MSARFLTGASLLTLALVSYGQLGPQGGGLRRFRGDVPLMLINAIRSQPHLRYTGTYTVEFRQGDTLRHQEHIIRDGPKYRIDFPSDSQYAGQVIVEDQNTRLHYRPGRNEIIQQPPRHGEIWEKVMNLAVDPRFRLNTAAGDTIAGQKTDQLVVADKFGNVLQRLYIAESGVIMKRLVFGPEGKPIGFFEFTQIDLAPSIDPSAFTIDRKSAKVVTPQDQLTRVSRNQGFAFRELAPSTGFRLESAYAKKFAGVQGIVQTYLNGKVRLWVYELKGPVDPTRLRKQARKNEHFFSWLSNGETVILMGNIPEHTLERFASSMSTGTQSPSSKL